MSDRGAVEQRTEPVQHAWPEFDCYGCGPANPEGLGIESYREGERLVATFDPDESHTGGAPGAAYGGLIASLIDCHSVWTAITFAHDAAGVPLEDQAFKFVTGELSVDYERPTPIEGPIHLEATIEGEVRGESGERVTVTSELGTGDAVTARGEVLAVEVSDRY